jgi:hypothetical protein
MGLGDSGLWKAIAKPMARRSPWRLSVPDIACGDVGSSDLSGTARRAVTEASWKEEDRRNRRIGELRCRWFRVVEVGADANDVIGLTILVAEALPRTDSSVPTVYGCTPCQTLPAPHSRPLDDPRRVDRRASPIALRALRSL